MTAVKTYLLAFCLCLSSTVNAVVLCCDFSIAQSEQSAAEKPPCHEQSTAVEASDISDAKTQQSSDSCCDCMHITSIITESSMHISLSKVIYQSQNEVLHLPMDNSIDDPPIIFS